MPRPTPVYDERTQPENPLLARMWFLLLGHCERFTLRTDGDDVVAEVRGAEHRVPGDGSGLPRIREIARDRRGRYRRVRETKMSERVAAALAAVTRDWQRTGEIADALDVSPSAAFYHLTELHKADRIERRITGRILSWRLPQ